MPRSRGEARTSWQRSPVGASGPAARRSGRTDAPARLEAVVREADVVLSIVAPPEAARRSQATSPRSAAVGGAAPCSPTSTRSRPTTARAIEAVAGRSEARARRRIDLRATAVEGRHDPHLPLGRACGRDRGLPFEGVEHDRRRRRGRHGLGGEDEHGVGLQGHVRVLAQALLAAEANGVLDAGARRTSARGRRSSSRASSAGWRWRPRSRGDTYGEMREIAATQEAAGLTPALFEAMAEVYSALATRASSPARRRKTSPQDLTLAARCSTGCASAQPDCPGSSRCRRAGPSPSPPPRS